jgi:hypothetical protein
MMHGIDLDLEKDLRLGMRVVRMGSKSEVPTIAAYSRFTFDCGNLFAQPGASLRLTAPHGTLVR